MPKHLEPTERAANPQSMLPLYLTLQLTAIYKKVLTGLVQVWFHHSSRNVKLLQFVRHFPIFIVDLYHYQQKTAKEHA